MSILPALPEANPLAPGAQTGSVVRRLLPGLILTAGIAAAAFALRQLPVIGSFSAMILAILGGAIAHNTIGTPLVAKPGIKFALRPVLRLGIILLGLQLTAAQLAAVGWTGIAIIATTLVATFVFTKWMGRLLGVERKLAELIAAGTSVCGASAIIATNSVTEAGDEDVAYGVACVTIFGSLAMFLYPLLPSVLGLSPHLYGLWAGASIHEIAQVVAASFQDGESAGNFGTVAKLSRVMMLAPLVISLGLLRSRRGTAGSGPAAKAPVPWFVLGFLALTGLNSVIDIPHAVTHQIALVTTFLLSMSLAAMGLEMDIRALKAKGLRPLVLGALSWAFIALFSLALVELTG
jgi:uncharacterized integral membrane protein (TIGR00698 family)